MNVMEKPAIINGYDLLKTFALITMIVDHIGYYFYPDDLWWRIAGRMGIPVWFFLIGYARSRDLSVKLLGGAFVLLAVHWMVGAPLLPLNVLFTIIFVRMLMDGLFVPLKARPWVIWPMTGILMLCILPTDRMTEYGTLAMMFALFGYLVRHGESLPYTSHEVRLYAGIVSTIFLLYQWVNFGFSAAQFAPMAIVTLSVCMALLDFKGQAYPALTRKMPDCAVTFLKICGRRTLEIYVIHLILFMALIFFLERDV